MSEGPAALEGHLREINLAGARTGYVLSAVLMPAGCALDYITVPDHAGHFLVIRLVAGAVAAGLLFVGRHPLAARHPVFYGAGPPLVCGTAISAMIADLGGLASPYYAGLNLCILAVGVLYVWRARHALAVCSLVVATWLVAGVPNALAHGVEFRPLFNNAYFLALTTVIAVASTLTRFMAVRREFDAQAALSRTSAELRTTLTRLEQLDRSKNEFFANVSHELRTPLTLIIAPVEELMRRPGADEALQVVARNAQRLLRLVDDLLDLASLDGGALRLRVAEAPLHELAERIVQAAQPTARARGLWLRLDAERVPDMHGDVHRLEMVLTNLVSNALKFTPRGGTVHVRVEARDERVRVSVTDDGPGLPPGESERVFDRFYQVEGSARRRHGGTGIGLALVREIVQLHGGEVGVISEAGRGASFWFELPRGAGHFDPAAIERRVVDVDEHPHRRAVDLAFAWGDGLSTPAEFGQPIPAETAPRFARGRRARIVVAEDEPELRALLVRTLGEDHDVHPAADGAEALGLVKELRPDLVLTDVMMPGSSGDDLCRAIKHDPALSSTPVILLTARSGAEAALEGYHAGADDFVNKPFHARVLLARVRVQLRLRALSLELADKTRLASVGLIAASVAHEVKNPVNALVNAARVLMRRASDADRALLEVLIEASTRIASVVGSLETHARPADGDEVSACDVAEGVASTLALLAHRTAGVQIVDESAAAGHVRCAPRALNQGLLNVLDNALRAGARRIEIRGDRRADRVELCIANDGASLSKTEEAQLFQPFSSNRSEERGSGLGLYFSRELVNASGGELRYRPRKGGGAEFVFDLEPLSAP